MAEDAKVRVIVTAITERAEQAIESVGDEILNTAADAEVGQASLDDLGDEMGQTARRGVLLKAMLEAIEEAEEDAAIDAQVLANRINEMGDESVKTAGKMATLRGIMTGLNSTSNNIRLQFSRMTLLTQLSLIPALIALLSTLAPLVAVFTVLTTGAFALAGAFAAIVGSGFLAWGQQMANQNEEELAQTKRLIKQYETLQEQLGGLSAAQENRLEQLREKKDRLEDSTTAMGALRYEMGKVADEIRPMIVAFGQEFIPLVRSAVEELPFLVSRMIDSVGSTEEFKEVLRDFGRGAMRVIPALTGFMFELARDGLPLLREFTSFMLDNGGDAWDAMMEAAVEAEPELRSFLDTLIEFAPVLLEFGTNALKVLLPMLGDLIRALQGFMETINGLPKPVRDTAIQVMFLLPLLSTMLGVLTGLLRVFGSGGIIGGIKALIAGFTGLSGAAAVLVGGPAGGILGGFGVWLLHVSGIMDMIGEQAKNLGKLLGEDMVSWVLTLQSVLSFGLLPVLVGLGEMINALVQGNWSELMKGPDDTIETFGGAFGNVGQQLGVGGPSGPQRQRGFPGSTRSTRHPDAPRKWEQTNNQDIQIDVDAQGDAARNPREWSQNAGDQMKKEARLDWGTLLNPGRFII